MAQYAKQMLQRGPHLVHATLARAWAKADRQVAREEAFYQRLVNTIQRISLLGQPTGEVPDSVDVSTDAHEFTCVTACSLAV